LAVDTAAAAGDVVGAGHDRNCEMDKSARMFTIAKAINVLAETVTVTMARLRMGLRFFFSFLRFFNANAETKKERQLSSR
jgi:hypothetical protein